MESLLAFILFGSLFVLVALLYKKRKAVAHWLEDPDIEQQMDNKRRKLLLQRRIEDAQDIIRRIDDMESKG